MANNQPIIDEDSKFDAIKGKIPGLEDEPAPSDADKKAQEEKEKADADAKAAADKKAEEDANIAKGLNPDGTPKVTPGEKKEKGQDDPPPPPPDPRPLKYIPIKQYTEEKRKWNETADEFKTRISELETALAGRPGTKKSDDAIKAYAEKYDADEEQIRELREALGVPDKKVVEAPGKISAEDQATNDRAREIVANQMFNDEYVKLAVPQLQTLYPTATAQQLEKAKEIVEQIATTEEYLDKSLDFVVFKNKDAFEKLFAPDRKGPETTRQAPDRGKSTYTASDFASGQTPFSTLAELPSEEQGKIVEAMDLKTYDKYMNWINQNDTLVINRGGRKVKS
jgi:hypothetical protein